MAREVTKEQFADGTTIDGDRIDRAMQETVDRFNAVRKGDLANRFLKSTLAMGWQPRINASAGTDFPFLDCTNDSAASAPVRYENESRVKGIQAPGLTPGGASTSRYIGCTIPVRFPSPVIVDDVVMMLNVEHLSAAGRVYTNGFTYGSSPPKGFTSTDSVEDLSLVLQVDSPLMPEDQRLADKVFAYHRVQLLRDKFWQVDPGTPPANDMTLADGTAFSTVSGVYYRAKDLAIPLPAGARLRIHLVLPKYPAVTVSGWGTDPITMQTYDLNVCSLEEVA